jgi:zinc and cadmium transporter
MHPLDIHWIYSLGSVALVAAFSLLGMISLSLDPRRVSQIVPALVSLSAGALLGTAMGHLLPESFGQFGAGPKLSGLLLAGFCTFFVLEKIMFLRAHHSGSGSLHQHSHLMHPETFSPATMLAMSVF